MTESIGTPSLYFAFTLVVCMLLAVDFVVLKTQGNHAVSAREAGIWSIAWIAVSLAFCGWFWRHLDVRFGRESANEMAAEFLTGYLIEKSLAIDNVFVWITLFNFFAVPAALQKRVLLFGVLGAIAMRSVIIFLGALLLTRFHWVLYIFGLFLVITGIKMLLFAGKEPELDKNPLLGWMRRHMRITSGYEDEKFFILRNGMRYATPLFIVLVMVETTDLIFAVDSIPAIFAVTEDPFIVITSNIFAILGLRAMYFLLADMAQRFSLLKYGLAVILMFIGVKMLLLDIYKIPTIIALGVVLMILLASVLASMLMTRQKPVHPKIHE